MFYIVSNAGISITEQGRSLLFIPKSHEDYGSILGQIDNMSYNDLQKLADNKSSVSGYIDDSIEAYENDAGDFEICLSELQNFGQLEQYLKDAFIEHIAEIKDYEFRKKGRELFTVLKNSKISSIKLTLN